jgi:hypothetical protein
MSRVPKLAAGCRKFISLHILPAVPRIYTSVDAWNAGGTTVAAFSKRGVRYSPTPSTRLANDDNPGVIFIPLALRCSICTPSSVARSLVSWYTNLKSETAKKLLSTHHLLAYAQVHSTQLYYSTHPLDPVEPASTMMMYLTSLLPLLCPPLS